MNKVIVDQKKFLSMFSKKDRKNSRKYFKAVNLFNKIKNKSEIAEIIEQPGRTVNNWLNKEKTPSAIRAINQLKANNLLPLINDETSDSFNLFVDVFAFVFGDGSIKKDFSGIDLFGQEKDLILLKDKLDRVFSFNSKITLSQTPGKITKKNNGVAYTKIVNGSCYRLSINSVQLSKLLYLAGAPKGDKVAQKVLIPFWLMSSSKETKMRFLSVLFGNELQCPQLRAKNAFTSSQFGLHKIESKKKELKTFLDQIKILLNEFGISTSSIAFEKCRTIRKDGNLSMKLYFHIDSHSPNVLRLFKEIPFKYAEEKQERFRTAVKKFLKKSSYLNNEWILYEKVMKMHSEGLGRRKIFKKLELPKKYFYKINSWIHYGHKPLYFDEKKHFFFTC
ncbi:MAG: hypothetical protein ABH986_05535 [archaeon]